MAARRNERLATALSLLAFAWAGVWQGCAPTTQLPEGLRGDWYQIPDKETWPTNLRTAVRFEQDQGRASAFVAVYSEGLRAQELVWEGPFRLQKEGENAFWSTFSFEIDMKTKATHGPHHYADQTGTISKTVTYHLNERGRVEVELPKDEATIKVSNLWGEEWVLSEKGTTQRGTMPVTILLWRRH